jgi:hypothetical protein
MSNTVTFVASRRKVFLLLLISMCLVALGIWLLSQWRLLGWLTVAFFGLGIPISLLMLVLPNLTYLRLDEEGFEMGSGFRSQKYKWTDVADFRIGSIQGAKMIAVIFHPEYEGQKLARAVVRTLSGMEGAIPNHYNATLGEILEALTTWRQRYGRRAPNQHSQPTAG